MPRRRPVVTKPSANGSAERMTTPAAKMNRAPTAPRRKGAGNAPIIAAGPTRSGSTASDRAATTAYAVKRLIRIRLSAREMPALNGRRRSTRSRR